MFLARMEVILRLYMLPYNPSRLIVCFDERPCFLIGDTIEGLEIKSGQVAKENYAYTKHGSCCVLAMIEPLTGKGAFISAEEDAKKNLRFTCIN
jgi:hypothetical protein